MTRHGTSRASVAVVFAILGATSAASAQRPALAGESTFGAPDGEILVHYATSGADAVPVADINADGVPCAAAQHVYHRAK